MSNFIVCGPPGSGKSTLVKKNARWGDLVIDTDAIYHAISGLAWYEKPDGLLNIVFSVRDTLVNEVRMGNGRFYNSWLILGGADPRERARFARLLDAKVIVLETSANDCLKNIFQDEHRSTTALAWQPIIEKWWKKYQPRDTDLVLKNSRVNLWEALHSQERNE